MTYLLFDQCKFEVYFVQHKYCYSWLFSGAIGFVNLLPAFHPTPVLVSVIVMGLPFSSSLQTVSFDGGVKSINIQC
jgi:hypothetical protein